MNYSFLHRISILFFCQFLFINLLISQQVEIRFNQLSINDGLSQSTVYSILQDDDGFIWIGTQDGLNEFDGYNVKQYKHQIKNSNSLSDSYINHICKGDNGNLWIGTQRGLNHYNRSTKEFNHIKLNGGLDKINVVKIIRDNKKRLWIGTLKYGLICYDPADSTHQIFNKFNGLPSNKISDLLLNDESLIVATSNTGISELNLIDNGIDFKSSWNDKLNNLGINCLFRKNSKSFYVGTNSGVNLIEQNEVSNLSKQLNEYQIMSIYVDSTSDLWLGTYNNGLVNCDLADAKLDVTQYESNDYNLKSLSNNLIHDIFKDATGTLWVGTQDGMSYFDPLKQSFANYSSYLSAKKNVIDKNAWGVFEQGDSVLWIGNRKGITRVNKKTGNYFNYPYFSENLNNPNGHDVFDVIIDAENRIWAATNGGLYQVLPFDNYKSARFKKVQFRDPVSKKDDDVAYDLQIHKNQLWIGCKEGLAVLNLETLNPIFIKHVSNEFNSLPQGACRRIYSDSKGYIWVGLEGAGVSKLEVDSSDINNLTFNFTNYDTRNGLSHNTVLSILEGDDEVIWIGTFGGGLNKLDTSNDLFTYYTDENGLSNNSIYGILEGQSGELWISTNTGLSCFNIQNETFNIFTESDGLLYNELNNGSFHKGKSGRLYFGGSKGVNSFLPNEIRQNTIPPKIVLDEIVFLNNNSKEEIPKYSNALLVDTLILNYNQNSIVFHFVGLHYTFSKGNKYKIHLEGLYDEPREVGELTQQSYSNIPTGDYTFKVWAANSDGIWSKPKSIHIKINSPFWKRWRFIAIVVAASILIFWGIYFLRLRAIKRQKRRLAFLVERRTKTVTKQKEQIEKQNKKIELERQKAEELLLNILPAETAEELKNKGKARTRQYRMVTVMFTDIKDFTKVSETMKPVDLVKSLDTLFIKFDKIIEKHQIEKIKTMGDAYMAAGGVPLRDKENPINCVLAALEIQQYMNRLKEEAQVKGENFWELRIGIHTGDVIAGVIGSKRIAYDIWGNTVNIAQRMETSGEVGRVNVSETTYEYISPFFECSSRGKIPTKNTGEISMFYVDRIKKHLSSDENGYVPNKKFNEYVNLHIYSSINYKKAERHIMRILRDKLPPNLHYHGIHHTLDVVDAVERIAIMEGVLDEDVFVLKSAATYHDAGFVEKYDENEVVGASMAAEILPKYGYTDEQIKQVWALIYATIIPHKPNNHLEQIICDADLDYLGRDDFPAISDTLRRELRDHGKIKSDRLWDEIQVKFLTQHKYFTKSAKKLRGAKKKKHLEQIKQRLKDDKYKD